MKLSGYGFQISRFAPPPTAFWYRGGASSGIFPISLTASITRRLNSFIILAALSLFGFTNGVFAQWPQTEINPVDPPTPHIIQSIPQQETGETADDLYWEDTVARALLEFQSENPEVRRSAIMLLGKYPAPPAQEAVLKALKDPADSVRQAALVSLFESPRMLTSEAMTKVITLVGDPSVSIRRIASNKVGQIMQWFPMTFNIGNLQPQQRIPAELLLILQDAFSDEDVSVRRNMVTSYPMLRIPLPSETIVALLRDPDSEVAIQTLGWGIALLSPQLIEVSLPKLVERPEPIFRSELARHLGNQPLHLAKPALERLQEDETPRVAIEARLSLFQHSPTPERYRQLLAAIHGYNPRQETINRAINATNLLGDEAVEFLRQWIEAPESATRQQATMILLSRAPNQAVDMALLLRLLDDQASQVREQVIHFFLRQPRMVTPEIADRIVSSSHSEVRRYAVQFSAILPQQKAENLLMELLLDESVDVRIQAIHAVAERQFHGWRDILILSLQDSEPAIQHAAIEWLLRNLDEETLRQLRNFLEENPRSPLRAQIEMHLRRHGRAAL